MLGMKEILESQKVLTEECLVLISNKINEVTLNSEDFVNLKINSINNFLADTNLGESMKEHLESIKNTILSDKVKFIDSELLILQSRKAEVELEIETLTTAINNEVV